MRRRDFLKTIAAGAALGLCGLDRAWGRQRRPNFVFFLIDTIKAQLAKIERIDERIDCANRVALVDKVIEAFRQQS